MQFNGDLPSDAYKSAEHQLSVEPVMLSRTRIQASPAAFDIVAAADFYTRSSANWAVTHFATAFGGLNVTPMSLTAKP